MHVTVASLQMSMTDVVAENVATAERLVRDAAAQGAQIVLIPELFEGYYFCVDQLPEHFARALPLEGHPTVEHFRRLAAELEVVLPLSVYERAGQVTYNTVVVIDADGSVLGTYRKSHIPDGPGYQEKYYFRPGDTGFKVWNTRHGRIGVGICWDQWYPETARAMMLQGAEVLMYPTAIGSEPHDKELDTAEPWRRAMQGHAVSNVVPVVGANRIGHEQVNEAGQVFYGSSFIADHRGDLVESFGREEEGALVHTFDLDFIDRHRAAWGFFRDRRTDLYGALVSPRPA